MSKTPGSGGKRGDEGGRVSVKKGDGDTRISKEEVYKERTKLAKRKCSELEEENNRLVKKVKKAKKIIARLRLERSFLFDKLEQFELTARSLAASAEAGTSALRPESEIRTSKLAAGDSSTKRERKHQEPRQVKAEARAPKDEETKEKHPTPSSSKPTAQQRTSTSTAAHDNKRHYEQMQSSDVESGPEENGPSQAKRPHTKETRNPPVNTPATKRAHSLAFDTFCQENHKKVVQQDPKLGESEIVHKLATMWQHMSQEEKSKYYAE